MADGLFDNVTQLLEKSLDLRFARHGLIASNIANAETPGYRALDLNFEEVLREMADRQKAAKTRGAGPLSASDIRSIGLRLIPDDTPSMGSDNNTVLIEREMGKLSKNSLMFRAQMDMLAIRLRILRDAITKGSE